MKSMIGVVLAFALGFACRAFGIPSPAPPLILGALLVMTMTIGYIAVDIVGWRRRLGTLVIAADRAGCPRLRHIQKVRSTERCQSCNSSS